MATYDEKTPTKVEVKESICKKLNMNPETVEVVKISQEYGNKSSAIVVYAYETKELMQKMAPKIKEKKAPGEPKSTAKATPAKK